MLVTGPHLARGKRKRGGHHSKQRRQQNTTIPAPISASVSQYWEGNDGPWSSFAIQVGQRAQNVRVLPSTASTSTWVVYEEGCPSDAPSNCPDSRGGTFNPNSSLTYVPNSIFELGLEENLDYDVFGDFAFDTVTLGWQGSEGPSVEHSVIAGIADTSFSWLGVIGLNPRPTNFSTFPNNPQVSFVQALRNQNEIPSLSWAYTAGAQYRLDKVFGSLIFGGYDEARFTKPSGTAQGLTFPFYTDIARDLLVGISSITTSKTTSSSSESKLLEDGIFAFIDSTVPHFWLPQSVCESFEKAFGLSWNSTSELYTLNSSQHKTLSDLNPSVTFTLSPNIPASATDQSVPITLPYSAFDLNTSWPHAESSTYYFPLKRAANETQYTLGRAFLQEAYLVADYERQNFSVWPCKWDSGTKKASIIPILSKDAQNNSSSSNANGNQGDTTKSGLSTGATAGIGVGAALGVIALVALIWFFIRRRRSQKKQIAELEANGPRPPELGQDPAVLELPSDKKDTEELDSKPRYPDELDSTPKHEMAGHDGFPGWPIMDPQKCGVNDVHGPVEVDGQDRIFEMDGNQKGDLVAKHEMDGAESAGGGWDKKVVTGTPPTVSANSP